MDPDLARRLGMYRTMAIIRNFEEQAHQALLDGFIFGPVHQSTGQEAVAAGVCGNLRRDDLLFSNHRGHGHAIAKGADPVAMMKELFGRVGGTSGGKGGSMHIADFSVGMLGANGILADGVPMAVGAAQAVVLKGESKVVAVFVGDGTTNRGPFFEAMNWAKVFELPVLIVCEDNVYASSTLTSKVTAGDGPSARARAFAIATTEVDGNDIDAVDAAAGGLVAEIRSAGGPRFLHARTYRVKGHISRDTFGYRAADHDTLYLANDPLFRARGSLLTAGVDPARLHCIESEAAQLIDDAIAAAAAAPVPDATVAYQDVQDVRGLTWLS